MITSTDTLLGRRSRLDAEREAVQHHLDVLAADVCDDAAVVWLLAILRSIPAVLTAARAARWETCLACGCLCLPDEVCPGCRAARTWAA